MDILKGGMMSILMSLRNLSSVRAFNVILKLLWFVCIYGAVDFIIRTPRRFGLLHEKPPVNLEWVLSSFMTNLLGLLIYFWILYHLERLMRKIRKGNPFDPLNPVLIREVAYGVIAMAIVLAAYYCLNNIFRIRTHFSWLALRSEITQLLWLALIAAGILVIAKVFEMGVKLQQDQNLTI